MLNSTLYPVNQCFYNRWCLHLNQHIIRLSCKKDTQHVACCASWGYWKSIQCHLFHTGNSVRVIKSRQAQSQGRVPSNQPAQLYLDTGTKCLDFWHRLRKAIIDKCILRLLSCICCATCATSIWSLSSLPCPSDYSDVSPAWHSWSSHLIVVYSISTTVHLWWLKLML